MADVQLLHSHDTQDGHAVKCVAFAPGGRRVAASAMELIRLFDVSSLRLDLSVSPSPVMTEVLQLKGHTATVSCLDFSHGKTASMPITGGL